MTYFKPGLALCASFFLSFILVKVSSVIKVYDKPDAELKPHKEPVPYLGGISFLAATLLFSPLDVYVLLFLVSVALIGFVDDIVYLSPVVRIVSASVVSLAFLLVHFGYHGIIITVLSVLALLVIVNVVNWTDGMDGLLAGNAIINLAGLYFLLKPSSAGISFFSLVMVCALAGYIFWNTCPARIYMGDGGSYFIGAVFYFIIIKSWIYYTPAVLFTILVNLSLYFIDGGLSVIRRLFSGKKLMHGDRDHYYDKLFRRIRGDEKKKTRRAVFLSYALNAVYVFLGYLLFIDTMHYVYIIIAWSVLSCSIVVILNLYKYDQYRESAL